jgi:hypothetical protein
LLSRDIAFASFYQKKETGKREKAQDITEKKEREKGKVTGSGRPLGALARWHHQDEEIKKEIRKVSLDAFRMVLPVQDYK